MDPPISSRLVIGPPEPEISEPARDGASLAGMRCDIGTATRISRLVQECLKLAETQRPGHEEAREYALSTDPDGHF